MLWREQYRLIKRKGLHTVKESIMEGLVSAMKKTVFCQGGPKDLSWKAQFSDMEGTDSVPLDRRAWCQVGGTMSHRQDSLV